MIHSTASHRRIATTLAAGLVGAGLFLTPAVAFADTGQTVVQTTDPAGDARANLHNFPTADLLAAGARIGSSTVTVFFDLGTAPTQAQLADAAARGLPYGGRYDYTSTLDVSGGVPIGISFHDTTVTLAAAAADGEGGGPDPTPACVAYFGGGSTSLQGPVVVDGASGELSATFSRADFNAAASCFGSPSPSAGTQVAVAGANSDIQTPYKNALSGGATVRDSAGAGPSVTLAN